MVPKKGGSPLPPSPICLPREHHKAAAYVLEIQEALKRAGWTGGQRGRLRSLLRLWEYRAEGRDPQFEQYGSFGRRPGSAPPTGVDATVEAWRRLIPHDRETMRRRKVPWTSRELARERDRFKQKRRRGNPVT
jgi:hypothetical protein